MLHFCDCDWISTNHHDEAKKLSNDFNFWKLEAKPESHTVSVVHSINSISSPDSDTYSQIPSLQTTQKTGDFPCSRIGLSVIRNDVEITCWKFLLPKKLQNLHNIDKVL